MAKRHRYIINGFRSGWKTNLGPTVFETKYEKGVLIGDESWAECKNVYISPFGTIAKRLGCTKKHVTALEAPPVNIHQYWTSQEASHLLAFIPRTTTPTSADALTYSASGASGTWVSRGGVIRDWSGSDIDNKLSIESFADKLVISNGINQPAYWDAASAAFTSMPSTCYPAAAIKGYKNYLFLLNTVEAGGTTFPGRARWCKAGDAFTAASWPAAYYKDIEADDGDHFVGAALRGDSLICFKQNKIYAIDYIGGPWMFDWSVRPSGRGCVSGNSLVPVNNDLVFLAKDGFYKFVGNDIVDISYQIKDEVMNLHPDYWHHVMGAAFEEENQVWFTVPYAGKNRIGEQDPTSTRPCNEVWVYDYVKEYWTRYNLSLCSLGGWYRAEDLTIGDLTDVFFNYDWAWNDRFGTSGIRLLVAGDYGKFVTDQHLGGYDATSVNLSGGVDIDAWVKTRWIDFGDPTRTDRITRIIFVITPEGESATWNIDVTIRTDWDDSDTGTAKTISVVGDSKDVMVEKRIDWTFQARSFQFQFGTDKGGEPFTIHEIIVEYEPKSGVGWPGSYGYG